MQRISVVVSSALLATALGYAQVDTGTISGVVRDSSAAVITSASLRIVHLGTAASVTLRSDGNGLFSAPALRPGEYQVSASANGFQTETKRGIVLRVQDRIALSFELAPSQVNSEVTVEDRAPLLESQTSSLGHVAEEKIIKDLPLNGRSFIKLATLAPGTTPSLRSAERNTFVANGTRPIQNSYILDGVENKNKIVGFDSSTAQVIEPVLDGIQEFKVQTNAYSAEFGQAAGAVVNVTLKSGTNSIHGSAFDFVRNSFFDARPYFQATPERPLFIQNQFGATLGGPIIKDRTFAFASWQSQREVNSAPQVASVPTAIQKGGQFGAPVYDPATTRLGPDGKTYVRDLFPGNFVPANRFDPVSAKLVSLFPNPTAPGSAANFTSNQRQRISNDQVNVRVDHRLGARDNFFARYSSTVNTNILPAPLPEPANSPSIAEPVGRSWAGSETHTFGPTLISEVRFGYTTTRLTQQVDKPRLFEQYGITGAPNYEEIRGLPLFSVTGLSTLGTAGPGVLGTPATGSGNLPIDKQGHVLQLAENLSWVKGKHTLKFGFDHQEVLLYAQTTLQARPTYNFNGTLTQDPQKRPGTGAAFADFLLGYASGAGVSTRGVSESKQNVFQGYVQDDWVATRSLTLNLGLRYELAMPFYETAGHYSNLVLEPGPLYGTVLDAPQAGKYGYRRSFTDPDWNNFAPRVGLAYKATQKTVIRSAFGVFYGRDENVPVARRPTNNPPYFVGKTYVSDQITPALILGQGIPSNALDVSGIQYPDVNSYLKSTPLPYVLQWNFNAQRELAGGFVLQTGYVGSGGRKLYTPLNVNLPAPGAGAINPRRPIPNYGGVFALSPSVNSSYNAFTTQLERRYSKGLSFLGSYTWAHTLDYAGANSDSDTAPQDPRNLTPNRGNAATDVRHRAVFSGSYELPFGRGRKFLNSSAVASAIAGGWQISGITSYQTGLPFTPVLATDVSNTGTTARPNRVADGNLPSSQRTVSRWFDLSAFTTPAQYTFGNAGRNILRGPGLVNTDVSLARSFRISERSGVQFRAEAFNLFNTPQFGLPGATIGTASVGVITTVVNPERQLQFAARFSF